MAGSFEALLRKYLNEFNTNKHQQEQLEKFKKQLEDNGENKLDKDLWNRFESLIVEYKRKNPGQITYFKFGLIRKLLEKLTGGQLPDFLFIYLAKNTGKTTAISDLCKEVLYEDPESQIFYLRTTQEELDKGFRAQIESEDWPFTLKSGSGELLLKDGYPVLSRARPKRDLLGWATHLSGEGTRSFQGSNYKKLRYLFWDECNDIGQMDDNLLNAFLIFVLSLERNNPLLKVVLTGNLLTKASGTASNAFLDLFNIPIDAKLRYREIPHAFNPEKKFTFLYINGGLPGELFEGTETQKFSNLLKLTNKEHLISNTPKDLSFAVINKSEFLTGTPYFAFVIKVKNIYYINYICTKRVGFGSLQKIYWMIHAEEYDTNNHIYGYYPKTEDILISSSFPKVRLVDDWKIKNLYLKLRKMLKRRKLFYSNSSSRALFGDCIFPFLDQKYRKHLKNTITVNL